jgi:hypothetical protein
MAKRKAAKKQGTTGESASDAVEPMVVALAEQLGAFLGRVQKKADGWLENEALRAQVSQIRDAAAGLLKQVGKAEKSEAKAKRRNGGAPDAPNRRLRKPPPYELFDPRLGEPMGKQMGQKSLKRRGRG